MRASLLTLTVLLSFPAALAKEEDPRSCEKGDKVLVRVIVPELSPALPPEVDWAPPPTAGGDLPSSPAQGRRATGRLTSPPKPSERTSSIALPPEPNEGMPFINSNPAVPLPTGEADTATVQPLPNPSEKGPQGYDYSEGVWQFEGHVFVRGGTSDASIMQVHRSNGQKPATDLILFVTDGDLRVYSGKQIKSNVYNRWMRVNVIHNVEANMLTVFIDGVQKLKRKGKGRSKFYFKFGVYAQIHASKIMESRWKGIKIFKK